MGSHGLTGQLCVYCQERLSTRQGDHVIGKGWMKNGGFTNTHPPIKVPACEQCQRSWSGDEHYLMSILPLDINNTHPTANAVAGGQITALLSKHPPVWKRAAFLLLVSPTSPQQTDTCEAKTCQNGQMTRFRNGHRRSDLQIIRCDIVIDGERDLQFRDASAGTQAQELPLEGRTPHIGEDIRAAERIPMTIEGFDRRTGELYVA